MESDSGRTTSVWMATGDVPEFGPLAHEASADVCVVGAGIAGLTTAYLLAREGKSVVVLVVVLTVIVWAVFVHPMLKEPPLVERDFTARVVDKSFTIRESDRALPPSMKLLVERTDGRRFNVGVTGEFYERARVGMWVSRRGGELRLHSDEPAPPGGEGAR